MKNRLIYMDHAATTSVHPKVLEVMLPYFSRIYGNPSSVYGIAQEARKALDEARATVAAMMVKMGDADAFVSGLTYDYPDVIRPALQIHHTRSGNTRAAGVYIMIVEDRVYLFTDATVNIDPTAEDLAEIACLAANFAKQLELEPRVAFLSFSNFGSTPHPLSDKVRRAADCQREVP